MCLRAIRATLPLAGDRDKRRLGAGARRQRSSDLLVLVARR